MKSVAFRLILFVLILAGLYSVFAPEKPHKLMRWEFQIQAIENRLKDFPPGGVFFYGSSSIRLWKTLAADFKPIPVGNGGFGGAVLKDLIFYSDRLLANIRPSAIVIYAGDNDMASKTHPSSPEDVLRNFTTLVKRIRNLTTSDEYYDDVNIFYISIKPSIKRFHVWDKMKKANELIKKFAARTTHVYFIDIAKPMLDEAGKPREELFLNDGLHLNDNGYKLWTRLVRQSLTQQESDPFFNP